MIFYLRILCWLVNMNLYIFSLPPCWSYFCCCSGEKTSANEWPGFLEIKGRVRLEAFEKFLQELPLSRSRAVMVFKVSLYCTVKHVSCSVIQFAGMSFILVLMFTNSSWLPEACLPLVKEFRFGFCRMRRLLPLAICKLENQQISSSKSIQCCLSDSQYLKSHLY